MKNRHPVLPLGPKLGPLALLFFWLLLLASPASAGKVSGSNGTLVTNQTGAGNSTNCVDAEGASSLALLYYGTAGTLSVKTQVCLASSPANCDQQSSWVDIAGSTTTTSPTALQISYPLGCYRQNFGSCSANCNITVMWRAK